MVDTYMPTRSEPKQVRLLLTLDDVYTTSKEIETGLRKRPCCSLRAVALSNLVQNITAHSQKYRMSLERGLSAALSLPHTRTNLHAQHQTQHDAYSLGHHHRRTIGEVPQLRAQHLVGRSPPCAALPRVGSRDGLVIVLERRNARVSQSARPFLYLELRRGRAPVRGWWCCCFPTKSTSETCLRFNGEIYAILEALPNYKPSPTA